MTKDKIYKTILIGGFMIMAILLFVKCDEASYYKAKDKVDADSVVIYKNKYGLSEAKLTAATLDKADLKRELAEANIKITRRTRGVTQVSSYFNYRDSSISYYL